MCHSECQSSYHTALLQKSVVFPMQVRDGLPEKPSQLDQLLFVTIDQLHFQQPLSPDDYANVDIDVQTIEQLDDGWELLEDFVANKTNESENIVRIVLTPRLIHTYSEAMKWAAELEISAAERSSESILQDVMTVES